MEKRPKQNRKRPYARPRLKTIELATNEVLGFGCKLDSSSGPLSPTCATLPCSQTDVS
jgi:hypothetical protein